MRSHIKPSLEVAETARRLAMDKLLEAHEILACLATASGEVRHASAASAIWDMIDELEDDHPW